MCLIGWSSIGEKKKKNSISLYFSNNMQCDRMIDLIFLLCIVSCAQGLITYRAAVIDFAGDYIPNTTNRTLALSVMRNNLLQYEGFL
jgi:hypothetical protein